MTTKARNKIRSALIVTHGSVLKQKTEYHHHSQANKDSVTGYQSVYTEDQVDAQGRGTSDVVTKLCRNVGEKSYGTLYLGDRGSSVVKVLCCKSEGRWFDPSCCHCIFH